MVFREGSWTEHLSQFFLSESDGKGKEEKSSLSNHSSFTQTNGWVYWSREENVYNDWLALRESIWLRIFLTVFFTSSQAGIEIWLISDSWRFYTQWQYCCRYHFPMNWRWGWSIWIIIFTNAQVVHITARITFIHVFIRSSNIWLSYILSRSCNYSNLPWEVLVLRWQF